MTTGDPGDYRAGVTVDLPLCSSRQPRSCEMLQDRLGSLSHETYDWRSYILSLTAVRLTRRMRGGNLMDRFLPFQALLPPAIWMT